MKSYDSLEFENTLKPFELNLGTQFIINPVINNDTLKKLIDAGHQLILFTMRSDRLNNNPTGDPNILDARGMFLTDAVNWFKENNIPLYGIQTNPTQKNWTTSPKSYAEIMIDDSALGCPLKYDSTISLRPFVDWDKVEEMLIEKGII
jgi:hypothetical protein